MTARALRGSLCLLICSATLAGAADQSHYLKGIRRVTVLIEELSEASRKVHLSEERLRTIVELKLRMARIRVVSTEADLKDTSSLPYGSPYLYVKVTVMSKNSNPQCFYAIDVDLRQSIPSPINGAAVPAVLWQRGGVAAAGCASIPGDVEGYLGQFLDSFVNDYLAANPRP
jgi:hypothetical protein